MNSTHKNSFIINSHKTILLCGLFILFLLSFVFLVEIVKSVEEEREEINVEEVNNKKEELKEEIKKVEEEIKKVNTELKEVQQKARTFKREISIYNNKIYKNELEVKETRLAIEESDMEMDEIKEKIEEGEIKKEAYRKNLKDLFKLLYVYEQNSILEILMTEDSFSDFFNKVDAMESVKNEVFKTIVNLKNQKEELDLRSEELTEQQEEKGQLIQIRAYQNESLSELKIQNNELLDITKGEEKQFQQLLAENKNILPSLRAQLYDLQSLGQKIEIDDAFSAAKLIGSAIGVRPAYLLGILKVESNLGKNTGSGNWEDDMYGCYMRLSKIYPLRKAHYIKRAETEKNAFFSIVDRLNLDPMSVRVSKEPTYGCGGAMGPAQFIPSTWLAYESRVSSVTRHYPPNPWNLTDAMAAMAVKVSDIPGVIGGDYNSEYEAAGRYLGGRSWRTKGLFFYPNKVMLYANLYEEELNSLDK
ncbi:lytic murein transglycosylase [Candidatus Parcubacteria bacterium]|nr:lytic murein transglycosylase [Candidatus Parcubacteria bacterium]